ncbi:MAG: phosphopentomutase [bacterium]
MRAIIIVLDSVGVGELPDAAKYGDEGSNTLAHVADAVGGLALPNLQKLGLGNIIDIRGVPREGHPLGAFGKAAERSAGKDTTTGHWEIAGLILDKPFPLYPNGFPDEVIKPFVERTGRGVLGNRAASGTEIIEELGEEHIRTGKLIVYTSADSVFQVAAHEDAVPVEELYRICQIAREILQGDHSVARVIARPFVTRERGILAKVMGRGPKFERTPRRRDFSLPPTGPTILDRVKDAGLTVMAVGKIEDIFAGRGITESFHTENNMDGVDKTIGCIRSSREGLIFANLVDFDMKYGHRNDPRGYAQALVEFDGRLPEIVDAMREEDVLILTADHGCDPTTPSTDHSREYVPILVYGKRIRGDADLGVRSTMADIAETVAEMFTLPRMENGNSFKRDVL